MFLNLKKFEIKKISRTVFENVFDHKCSDADIFFARYIFKRARHENIS